MNDIFMQLPEKTVLKVAKYFVTFYGLVPWLIKSIMLA
jgi:hypothetical protein